LERDRMRQAVADANLRQNYLNDRVPSNITPRFLAKVASVTRESPIASSKFWALATLFGLPKKKFGFISAKIQKVS